MGLVQKIMYSVILSSNMHVDLIIHLSYVTETTLRWSTYGLDRYDASAYAVWVADALAKHVVSASLSPNR